MQIFDEAKIELFISLFRGRADVFARHWDKDGKSGYAPAYDVNWTAFNEHKRRGGTWLNFKEKTPIPLTPDVIKKHLLGGQTVGVYPLLTDNTSYFVAADFDGGLIGGMMENSPNTSDDYAG